MFNRYCSLTTQSHHFSVNQFATCNSQSVCDLQQSIRADPQSHDTAVHWFEEVLGVWGLSGVVKSQRSSSPTLSKSCVSLALFLDCNILMKAA